MTSHDLPSPPVTSGGVEAERDLAEIGSELMAARRGLGAASQQVAAASAANAKAEARAVDGRGSSSRSREAINALRSGTLDETAVGGREVEVRVGRTLLKLSKRAEHALRGDNSVILDDFTHLQLAQPSWMATHGVAAGATHHLIREMDGHLKAAAVEAACTLRPGRMAPLDLSRFASRRSAGGDGGSGSDESSSSSDDDDEAAGGDALRSLDRAVRRVIGDRGAPFYAAVDPVHATNELGAGAAGAGGEAVDGDGGWWMRFGTSAGRAGPQQWGDLLVLYASSGEARMRVAGYGGFELRAGQAAVVSGRLWMRTVHQSGHVVALGYRSEPAARSALTRNATSSMLVRSGGAPPAPGTSHWAARQKMMREAEAVKRRGGLGKEQLMTPLAWAPSNQPVSREEEARREARERAKEDKAWRAKQKAIKRKPPVPRTGKEY